MTIAIRPGPTLPEPLARGLQELARQWRRLGSMRSLGRLLLALAVLAAIGMLLDLLLPLPTPLRWALWLCWVGLAAVGLVWSLLASWARRLSWAELAAIAERGNPDLAEQLVSTVELLDPTIHPHGSPELIRALTADTAARVGSLDLGRGLQAIPARNWLIAGLLAAGALTLAIALRPDPGVSLARRFFLPWLNTERVGRFLIAVEPGDTTAARGGAVAVQARLSPRFAWSGSVPHDAALVWTDAAGRNHRFALKANPADAATENRSSRGFSGSLLDLGDSLTYRVVSGSDQSRTHRVTVIDPPQIDQLQVQVQPPAYTGFPTVEARDPNRIAAWEGSTITFKATPNRPMTHMRLAWPVPEEPKAESAAASLATTEAQVLFHPAENGLWTASAEAVRGGAYRFILEDEFHLSNAADAPRRVIVMEDQAPELVLAEGDETLESRPDDTVTVSLAARDDVAVAAVYVRYAIDRTGQGTHEGEGKAEADQGELPVSLPEIGMPLVEGQAVLPLKPLELQPGDVVAYLIEAVDNRPGPRGPNRTRSKPRRLVIKNQADSLAMREGKADRDHLRSRLEGLRQSIAAHHQATVQLRYTAEASLKGNGKWGVPESDGLAGRRREAGEHVRSLETLSADLAQAGRFAALAGPARETAEVEAAGVLEILGNAVGETDPARRLADMRLSDTRIKALAGRVDELIRQFDELARQDDDMRKLQVLADSQENLAQQADALAQSHDASSLDELGRQQDALRHQVDDIVKRTPELKAEMLSHQAKEADGLAAAARDLANRQRAQERQTADSPARQALLRSIAREQQALALAARKLALDIDAPLQENGRGKLDLEKLAKPVDPLERGDLEPARQHIEQAERELSRLDRELEEVRSDPKTVARRLVKHQRELVERLDQAARANNPAEKARQAEVRAELLAQEREISDQARQLEVPQAQAALQKQASEAFDRALEAAAGSDANAQLSRAREAQNALNQLAEALPDAWQQRGQAIRSVNETRGKLGEIAREIERHLNETKPNGRPESDPVAAARELARRLEPLAGRARELAESVKKLDGRVEADPQRDRAAQRMGELAQQLADLQKALPPEANTQQTARAPTSQWQVLGPLPRKTAIPFRVGHDIDFQRTTIDNRTRKPATWHTAGQADGGKIDLIALLRDQGPTDDSVAFGVTEIDGGAGGPGQLRVGSDDSITVWLNGAKVFEFGGDRPWAAESDRINVTYIPGPNQLVIACGNGASDWAFSVASTPPMTPELAAQMAKIGHLRKRLADGPTEARLALDRLEQALGDSAPADRRAEEIARELRALQKSGKPAAEQRADLQRAAAGLGALAVPDAPSYRSEAVRMVQQAAANADKPTGQADLEAAARAAAELARRLTNDLSAAEQAAALARAEAGVKDIDDPIAAARLQGEIADDLSRIADPALSNPGTAEARDRANEQVEQARLASERASRLPGGEQIREAARAAAEDALEQLASALPRTEPKSQAPPARPRPRGPGDPELGQTDAQRETARALLARQRQIADELQSMLALEMQTQGGLRDEATALSHKMEALRQQIAQQGLSGAAQGSAQNAAGELQHQAGGAMRQSLEHLARGQLAPARDRQREAADHIENAARQAADTAAALRRELPADLQAQNAGEEGASEVPPDSPDGGQEGKGNLAAARAAQERAARQLAQARQASRGGSEAGQQASTEAGAQAAADSMRQAAQGLRNAAAAGQGRDKMAQSLKQNGAQGNPSFTSGASPQSGPGQEVAPHLGALDPAGLARSGRRWGELPGHLRNEIMQANQARYREDYARQIQLYFREIGGAELQPGTASENQEPGHER